MESVVIFKVKTIDLKKSLNQMKVAYKGRGILERAVWCEVMANNNEVVINVPGISLKIPTEVRGGIKFTIPFTRLQQIVKLTNKSEITFLASEGNVQIDSTTFIVPTVFFKNLTPPRSIKLPINYSQRELIQISDGYTSEELDFNNITPLIIEAKEELARSINLAQKHLNMYGVTFNDLSQLAYKKIFDRM